MSRFQCPCGHEISDVGFPCHEEHHVISDEDLDAVMAYGAEPTTIWADGFDDRARDLLECSQCGRLHLQKKVGVNEYATYAKEVDEAAHVVKLEAALYRLLRTYFTDPGWLEARDAAERLLKREP